MTTFSRTNPGLIAENRFRKDEIYVYTEGTTDYPFYDEIFTTDETLRKFDCLIRSLGGKEEVKKKLRDEHSGNARPYVFILDGHYDILQSHSFADDQVVLLSRHSFENYLLHEEPIKRFCEDRIHQDRMPIPIYLQRLTVDFQNFLKEIEDKFIELLVLDIAHQRAGTSVPGFLKSPDEFFTKRGIGFQDTKIAESLQEAKNKINCKDVKDTKDLVDEFLKERRFIDLLPGHFAFGLIRRFIIHKLRQGGTTKSTADVHIRPTLSREVWRLAVTRDHNSLKQQLRKAVQEADKRRR